MDRRTIWAILLMMAIAVLPAIFMKRPAPSGEAAGQRGSGADTARRADTLQRADTSTLRPSTAPPAATPQGPRAAPPSRSPSDPLTEDTVPVTSPLYRYGISTRGARLVEATLPRYRSMAPVGHGQTAEI